jgi:hypothetical protein
MIATAAASTIASPMVTRRSTTAIQPSTTSTGTSQTQWCTQETGDTSNPHNAVIARANGNRVRRTTNTVSARTTTANGIQSHSWDSRANAPRSDWLATKSGDPIRSPRKTSFVQYCTEGPGRSTKASTFAAAKVAADQIAAR